MSTSQEPAPTPTVAFVQSRWHRDIVGQAELGFVEIVGRANVEVFDVPGAFELPLKVRLLAETGRFDAIVAAGFVVDGGIYRHEFVAEAVLTGLMRVQLDLAVPVFSCVLTPQQYYEHDSHHQFFYEHMREKGREVAHACLATLSSMTPQSGVLGTPRIVVVDTTFARADMGGIVAARIGQSATVAAVQRVTVPGFKDLAAATRRAIDDGAAIVIACGMPGPEPIDESCASEASAGLQMVQALTGTSVLEVFVHMSEALDGDGIVHEATLLEICRRRCEGHADNALLMLFDAEEMVARAGTGRRQGADDEGTLVAARTLAS